MDDYKRYQNGNGHERQEKIGGILPKIFYLYYFL